MISIFSNKTKGGGESFLKKKKKKSSPTPNKIQVETAVVAKLERPKEQANLSSL